MNAIRQLRKAATGRGLQVAPLHRQLRHGPVAIAFPGHYLRLVEKEEAVEMPLPSRQIVGEMLDVCGSEQCTIHGNGGPPVLNLLKILSLTIYPSDTSIYYQRAVMNWYSCIH